MVRMGHQAAYANPVTGVTDCFVHFPGPAAVFQGA